MITIVGSMNIDLVSSMKEIPKIGETVLGNSFMQNTGGKGANQASAAAKLGSAVTIIGCIGDDIYGKLLINDLNANGVNVSCIKTIPSCSSGIAIIQVDEGGQNNIVVIPGSNYAITEKDIDNYTDVFLRSNIVIMQMEIPFNIVQYTIVKAKKLGCTTILNPAPACELSSQILSNTDIIVPNEHELQRITKIDCNTMEGIEKAAKSLLKYGIKNIIVTMGEKGVLHVDASHNEIYPANKVNVIDTTAAGDAFLGGFASYYERTCDIAASINYGQRVSAFAIQKAGAIQSLPSEEDINI